MSFSSSLLVQGIDGPRELRQLARRAVRQSSENAPTTAAPRGRRRCDAGAGVDLSRWVRNRPCCIAWDDPTEVAGALV